MADETSGDPWGDFIKDMPGYDAPGGSAASWLEPGSATVQAFGGIFGEDDKVLEKPWKKVPDDVLLQAIAAATWAPEGSDVSLFTGGNITKLLEEAKRRGLNPEDIPEVKHEADLLPFLQSLAKSTEKGQAKVFETFNARMQYIRDVEEEERRLRIIGEFEDAMTGFKDDPRLETLHGLLDKLMDTPTLSQEFMDRTRNEVTEAVRLAEVAKARKVRALFGTQGRRASGVESFLASETASRASEGLQKIFNQMALDFEKSKVSDAQRNLGLFQGVTQWEMDVERGLREGLAGVESGLMPQQNPYGVLQNFSGYFQGLEARAEAARLAAEQNRTAIKTSYINMVGDIVGGVLGGAGAIV